MRSSLSSTIIIAAGLFNNALALPRPATYSVVNVDGGQTVSARPTTIVQTVTESTESETTISVTITQSPPTPTVTATNVFTSLQTLVGHTTETALVPLVSSPILPPAASSSTPIVVVSGPTGAPEEPEAATVTVTAVPTSTSSTSYYDNGMWHTSYAVKQVWTSQTRSCSTVSSTPVYGIPGATGVSSGYAVPTGAYGSGWNSTVPRLVR